MAANKPTADKKATTTETADVLQTKRAELIEAKRSHAAGELVNPRVLRSLRKDIARELTAKNKKKEGEA